jgi:syntaxin 5
MTSNSGRDRTGEFAATVRSLKGRSINQMGVSNNNGGPAPISASTKHGLLAKQSQEFMTIAASIGKDIAKTYTKLEKLTLLAKRRTLFDDRPQEIQELISIIKDDTNALNRQINQLCQISKAQQQTLRSKHQASHSTTVVAALQLRLASMTSDFKQVLEVRSENLRESKSRREQFSQGAVTRTMPQSATNGFPNGSVLEQAQLDDEASKANHNGQVLVILQIFVKIITII